MKKTAGKFRGQGGFTMIEIISVLVIIGIMAAVAVVRMTDTNDYDLNSQVEAIKAHLRLAQFRAMSASSPYGINISSGTTYYLFRGIGSTTPVMLPGENNATVNLTTKKSRLSITSAPQVITFNAYGSPVDASNTLLTSNIAITTNGGDITVTKNTGFIP